MCVCVLGSWGGWQGAGVQGGLGFKGVWPDEGGDDDMAAADEFV